MTIKKAAKGIEITDEAVRSGYGDTVGEGVNQLKLSIAAKVDEDIVVALDIATANKTSTSQISYAGIVDAVGLLLEEATVAKFLFVHPDQVTTLRKDINFMDESKYGGKVMMTGEIGMIAGCRIIPSRRVPVSPEGNVTSFIVAVTPESEDGTPSLPAVSIFIKKAVFKK